MNENDAYGFLSGGGEMGARIRAHDWRATPLGAPDTWPQALKTSVRLLLSTGHPMFLWWGPELIQFYNDAYRRSIGPERHPSALGQRGRECWTEIWDIIGPQIEQVMTGGGHTWHENQLVPITRYGRREDVYWTYSYGPIDDPAAPNGVGGVLVVCTETTEQVLADRRKDEFLAMLAHELRNPLASIRNAGELLVRDRSLNAESRAIGDLLGRQVTQLSRMVDDLLDLSRITSGHVELQREVVELGRVVNLAIESIEPLLRKNRHDVDISTSGRLYAEADLARLVQSVSNVLTNATKYTPPGGRIAVRLVKDDGEGMIEISDDGAGITAAMLPKVFDLFVQDHRTLDRSGGGLGIGLSVVRRLVQMHGGTITAESEGRGKGSTFRIRLPLVDPPDAKTRPRSETPSRPRRVLVVDDNVDAADSLSHLLRLAGHDVETAYSAKQTLEQLDRLPIDVVLLDIGLPEIDGYEVARCLRARGDRCLIVAVTGYGQAGDVQRALDAGCDVHLTKPVSFDDLQRVLRQSAEPARFGKLSSGE